MTLKKIIFKPGVNRENTRYTNEGGWYACDKIRFRQGTPEKIGGWERLSDVTYEGTCRSLWPWRTFMGVSYLGVGTNLKYYIMSTGLYYDITPIRSTVTLTNPFTTTAFSTTVLVTHAAHGAVNGDFVTFSGASAVSGLTLNGEYQLTYIDVNSYTIQAASAASSPGATGGGTVTAAYQVNVGSATQVPLLGWGAGGWGLGSWGLGAPTASSLRIWNAQNFGKDLIYGPSGGGLYYWDSSNLSARGVALSSLGGAVTLPYVPATPVVVGLSNSFVAGTPVKLAANAGGTLPTGINNTTQYYLVNVDATGLSCNLALDASGTSLVTPTGAGSGTFYISVLGDVPIVQNLLLISDASRFVLAFGVNEAGSLTQDPLLIRWSDQESAINWTPAITSQAGSLRLSHGSAIIAVIQVRQEILVFTDTSLYSLQYLGPPDLWGSQLLADNISIISDRASTTAAGITYWMGEDKFYVYDGRTQTLGCDLQQYIFQDFNSDQAQQVFASTVEKFNEIWWFYCSSGSSNIDKYVVYNYLERAWYYGTLDRSAWIDASVISNYPIAAGSNKLIYQEYGVDSNMAGTPEAINAYIQSAEFDLDEDGDHFAFVWRVLPDITFRGSTAASPSAILTLLPLQNSGSGYTDPASVAGSPNGTITRTAVVPIEAFTGQVNIRVRARQMSLKLESNTVGTKWQLGAPRLDIRPDGRKS